MATSIFAHGDPPWVLGLSLSHNGAACLMRGGEIVVAVQEERLTRKKRARIDPTEHSLAAAYCLSHAGIEAKDLTAIGVCSQLRAAEAKGAYLLEQQLGVVKHGTAVFHLSHHRGHALHAFATSGFEDACVLVVDGMGSPSEDLSQAEREVCIDGAENGWEHISLYRAEGRRLLPLEKHLVARGEWLQRQERGMSLFRSLGGMYSAVAQQLFGGEMDAGHVMGLAAYGTATIPASKFFAIEDGRLHFQDSVPAQFRHDRRWPDNESDYQNLAASVQAALEEAVLRLAARVGALGASKNLCFAGGVALNVTTNERLIRESGFEELYVPAAAEDSGPAIGAGYHALFQIGDSSVASRLHHDSMGHRYSSGEIDAALADMPGLNVAATDVLEEAATRISRGEICGWFHGGSELGPRALGNRSILADPRDPKTKDRLNSKIKFRQGFRPFAPAILKEEATAWFECPKPDDESPFMLRAWKIWADKRALVPAIVHADGTGRAQTVDGAHLPRFHALIAKFAMLTGVPMLVNTSFNVNREPIVETPEDALWCFLTTEMDFCVLEDRLVTKAEGLAAVLYAIPRLVAHDFLSEGTMLSCLAPTPWGERRVHLSAKVQPLLAVIDGKATVADIAEKLRRATPEAIADRALIDLIVTLRRLRVVALTPKEKTRPV